MHNFKFLQIVFVVCIIFYMHYKKVATKNNWFTFGNEMIHKSDVKLLYVLSWLDSFLAINKCIGHDKRQKLATLVRKIRSSPNYGLHKLWCKIVIYQFFVNKKERDVFFLYYTSTCEKCSSSVTKFISKKLITERSY